METQKDVHLGVSGDEDQDRFKLDYEIATKTKTLVKAFWDGTLFHSHTLNLDSATARKGFTTDVAHKMTENGFSIPCKVVESELMIVAGKVSAARQSASTDMAEPEYTMVEIPSEPESSGIFRVTPAGTMRLANFTATIDEDVTVVDEVAGARDYVGHTWLDGRQDKFRMSNDDFASNEKLKAALFRAAGPTVMILAPGLDELRTAISARSQPARRTVTTTHGWNEIDGSWVYLTTNGFVDGSGFHEAKPDDPRRIDLGGDQVAAQLGLRKLDPSILLAAQEHIVEDFLQLHDRRVMHLLLASVASAALIPFAGATQRFVLWIKGLTGAGKSFAAKLAMNFFGDFDPMPGYGQFANWTWTANRLEKCGYFHRGALFLVDDFKPELTATATAVRVVQGYADGHGRGRLQADTRAATVWPIRGLLVATGEDLFQHQASALARTIVVDAPNLPKDLERGERCLEHRHLYRGVMADFLAHLIRKNRLAGFAATAEMYRGFYYQGIAGRQNDARIAANLGMLAAALGEVGLYLQPVWPSGVQDVNAFIHQDMVDIRDAMLDRAKGQQASEVFLDTLRRLIATKAVRITDWSDTMANGPRPPIGKLFDNEEHVAISMEGAMEEVQESLRNQGRSLLAASGPALLDQLCRDGLLLDGELQGMTEDHKGLKTVRRRIVHGGVQVRVALFPRGVLMPEDDQEGADD